MISLKQLFSHETLTSKDIAKDRLQLVLVHDRIDLTPGKMDQLREELADLISRYVAIDHDQVEIAVTNTQRQHCLTAQVFVIGAAYQ
jgi:cell division topological specificity factor